LHRMLYNERNIVSLCEHCTENFLEEDMRNKDYTNISIKISRTIQQALHFRNFQGIGRAIDNGIEEFTNGDYINKVKEVVDDLNGKNPRAKNAPFGNQAGSRGASSPAKPVYRNSMGQFPFRPRMPGSISGFVYAIVGSAIGIPLLIADLALAVAGFAGAILLGNLAIAFAVLMPITAAALGMLGYGITLRRRARRFERYRDAMDGDDFCTVAKIADIVGETQERTKKDLRRMITSGACPQGHLDRGETCFMVDDKTFQNYLEAEKAYLLRQKAQQAEQQKPIDSKEAELHAVRNEGNAYLQQIREANDALPGEVISMKLDCLETVAARIFECVSQNPEKLPDIRRLMRYYMPTTLKLVKAYQEFEAQPVQGENIAKAKAEIETALDTINKAFANLLDSLYADDALDISTDISTLEMMLKQEGLTGSDFEKEPNERKDS
jgi:5-bromo-4-chloroindolyl phosphate hydrolysis protein